MFVKQEAFGTLPLKSSERESIKPELEKMLGSFKAVEACRCVIGKIYPSPFSILLFGFSLTTIKLSLCQNAILIEAENWSNNFVFNRNLFVLFFRILFF